MRKFYLIIFVLGIFFISLQTVSAQTIDCNTQRCADCDLCGYCWKATSSNTVKNPPESWPDCQKCLYHNLGDNADAKDNKTVEINVLVNSAPTPQPGSSYTMLGCISTNVGDFTQPGAAASLTNKVLSLIFALVGGIAFIYFIYGVYLVLTSQSDPDRLGHGKRVIYGAIIGLVFVLAAVFIVRMITGTLLKIPGFEAISPTP